MPKLLKNISLYSLGELLNKSIQFLLLPLYTYFLSPADYGLLELTYLYGALLVIFYGFIIENGYVRLYFDKTDEKYRATIWSTSLFFKFIIGLFFLIISFLFSNQIAQQIFSIEQGELYIKLISISVFIKTLGEIPLKTLIVEKRALRFLINNVIFLSVSLTSTVYFVAVLKLNILGVLYGQILGASVQLITLLATESKWTYIGFSLQYLKGMLYFSIFLIPSQLASFVTYWSNRYFLQEYSTLDDVGTFSLGYKVASIIPLLLSGPIKKAIGPEIYELIDKPEFCRKKIRQFTLIILFLLTQFSLVLSVFSKELIMLMATSAYSSSYKVVFVLSMGYVIIGMAGIVVLPINITKKTWLITITWILSALLNLTLNYYLVDLYGKPGATYATFLTFFFILITYFIFSEMIYKVKFEYFKYLLIFSITCFSFYMSTLVHAESIWLSVIYKCILLIFTFIILFKIILNHEEKKKIFALLKNKLNFKYKTS